MKIYAGSYTKMINPEFGGTGEGVYCFDFDESNGNLSLLKKVNIVNPSYLCLFDNILYTFNEVVHKEKPCILAYRIGGNGQLKLLNKLPINGDTPCHITVSYRYRCVFVSCYGSGNVVVFSLMQDGSLDKAINDLGHHGRGVNKERQEGPHAHCALMIDERNELYIADLGTDKIYLYETVEREISLSILYKSFIKIPSGLGPRHLIADCSNQYLFVVTELIPRILMINLLSGEIVSSIGLPTEYNVGSASAIKMSADDTNHLYISERTGNSLLVFKYNIDKECLKLISQIKTNSITPRDFLITKNGNWVIVAGQDSDTLSIYKRKRSDGSLTLHNTIDGIRSISCLI